MRVQAHSHCDTHESGTVSDDARQYLITHANALHPSTYLVERHVPVRSVCLILPHHAVLLRAQLSAQRRRTPPLFAPAFFTPHTNPSASRVRRPTPPPTHTLRSLIPVRLTPAQLQVSMRASLLSRPPALRVFAPPPHSRRGGGTPSHAPLSPL